jgi:cytochrome c oxidase assembly factor CtaG
MKSLEKHIVQYGVMTSLGLIVFFFVMELLGLTHITELRALNAFIMFAGAFLAIRKFRDKKFNYSFNYLMGIGTGFAVGMITAVLFSVFVIAYLFLNPEFTEAIMAGQSNNTYLNELTLGMVIFIEAMGSSFIFSLVSMQWLKQDKEVTVSKPSHT